MNKSVHRARDNLKVPGCSIVSSAAVFWDVTFFGGALRDIQKTAAKETSCSTDFGELLGERCRDSCRALGDKWWFSDHYVFIEVPPAKKAAQNRMD